MPECRDGKRYLIRIIVDFICVSVVGIPIIIYFAIGTPFERGFYCDDDSIRYPYKDSTITNVVLYCVGIFLPVFVVCVTEVIRMHSLFGQEKFARKLLWNVYCVLWVFGFGACVSQLTTDIAKYTIGRLRPHFLYICKPDIDLDSCSSSHQYITGFTCTGRDAFKMKEARLSFPSGHASFSAYSMVFLAMYIQSRMTFNQTKLLKPVFQTMVLFAAFYTALSRVSDYKHHWSDVFAGSFQGTVVAIIVVIYVSDLFAKPLEKIREDRSLKYVEEDMKLTFDLSSEDT